MEHKAGEVTTKNLPTQYYVGIRKKKGVQPICAPITLYHGHNKEAGEFDVQVGFFLPKLIEGEGNIGAGEIPATSAGVLIHEGPYSELGNAHAVLRNWVEERGHVENPPYEVYLTDPREVEDPKQYKTEVVWPYKAK